MQNKIDIAAPAKINLHLEVLDKRQDGFHNLKSIFLTVDFCDFLHFELMKGEKTAEIIMKGLDLDLPIEKNIVFRSINLFRERTGFSEGLKVTVEKRIPAGGGLGGGSSDAAATLLALNELAGFPLNRAALLETAAALGSDVPFFICQTGAALVTGRGETIEPIKAPRLFIVLVNPGFPSDTAAAYRLLDDYRMKNPLTEAQGRRCGREEREGFTTRLVNAPEPVRAYLKKNLYSVGQVNSSLLTKGFRPHKAGLEQKLAENPARWAFKNDFLPVFGERERAVYDRIIRKLRDLGAGFAGLSGAGSSCFGVFLESESAQRAAAVLRGEWSFVECCISHGGTERI